MRLFWIFLLFLLPGSSAIAAVFCVDNSTELQDALDAAAANGESDEIRIASGIYTPPGAVFSYFQEDPDDLTLSGGWFPFLSQPCAIQDRNPFLTTIDGLENKRLFGVTIVPGNHSTTLPNRFELINLSFVNGRQTLLSTAPVNFSDTMASASLLIDRVYFAGNRGFAGAALKAEGGATITVRNSVFRDNTAIEGNGAIFVRPSADSVGIYFLNNTVIDNPIDTAEPIACGGLCIAQPNGDNQDYRAFIANNVLWNNDLTDLRVHFSVISYFFHNVVKEDSIFPLDESNNRSVDPRLSPLPLDFTPLSNSPLVDAGLPEPEPAADPPFEQNWSLGTHDFDGGATGRSFGFSVDIGAVESSFTEGVFSDRFESP